MTDISKCADDKCPLRESCWRWLAPMTSCWQSYGQFNRHKDADKCDDY